MNHSQKINKNWKAIYTYESAVVQAKLASGNPVAQSREADCKIRPGSYPATDSKIFFLALETKFNVEHLSIISIVW